MQIFFAEISSKISRTDHTSKSNWDNSVQFVLKLWESIPETVICPSFERFCYHDLSQAEVLIWLPNHRCDQLELRHDMKYISWFHLLFIPFSSFEVMNSSTLIASDRPGLNRYLVVVSGKVRDQQAAICDQKISVSWESYIHAYIHACMHAYEHTYIICILIHIFIITNIIIFINASQSWDCSWKGQRNRFSWCWIDDHWSAKKWTIRWIWNHREQWLEASISMTGPNEMHHSIAFSSDQGKSS